MLIRYPVVANRNKVFDDCRRDDFELGYFQ